MRRYGTLSISGAALAVGAVALGLLAYFSIHLSTRALKAEVGDRVSSTAAIGSSLVRSDMEGLVEVVQGYASRPSLLAAFEHRRDPGARARIEARLHELRRARPGIATTFLARPDGRLVAIDPVTPSIVGKDFSFRDWYRGVTRSGRPYVSRAYVSQAAGRPRVVAAAVPVRARGRTIAILVAAYRIDHFQHLVDALATDEGVRLRVTDQHGVLLAAPGVHRGLLSLRDDPLVRRALAGEDGVRSLDTPGGRVLSAYRYIPGLRWTISSSVPSSRAFAGVSTLRATVGTIAGALGVLLLVGAGALARSLNRRRAAETQLARQAAITRAVLDGVRDAVLMVGNDGRTLIANARRRELVADLVGAGPAEDASASLAAHLLDADRYAADRLFEAENPGAETSCEYESTSNRHFLRYSAPVYGEAGERLGRIVVVREVTAEREAEQLKDELVATVSHELRTPLTGVLGFAELLQQPGVDAETGARYAATIHSEATRLTKLINDFLDLQRIEDRGLTLDLEPVELGEILAQTVEVFAAGDGGRRIRLELPDEDLPIAADRERLTQVVANLLSNALKYSPNGGEITVDVEARDAFARVSVRDQGLGIPADQQSRLFTKFFRVDSSDTRSIGGTGLGLALTREIVEAHGGRVGVESVEGVGSTFWFELPSGSAPVEERPRVLIVEDDGGAAELLVAYLGDEYDVEVTPTGRSALERAQRHAPSVICLDIGLPGPLNGWQVLGDLKSDRRTAHVPVIVCTGSNGKRRAAALGAADFLTKPFARETLLEAVTKLLPERRGDVLVADDDATVLRLVGATLAGAGFRIREARDGGQALEAIAELRPDAIVLDLLMPGLDGFSVLERLQEDDALRTIPVLVLTAHRLTAAERTLLDERAVSLLQKSEYSRTELRRLIEQALGRAAALAG